MADRLAAAQRAGATEEKQHRCEQLNETEKHLILLNLNLQNQEDNDLAEVMNDQQASSSRLILALRKAKIQFSKRRKSEMDEFDKRVEQGKQDKVKFGKLKNAF